MSAQPPLFFECTNDALREAVRASGGTKIVGPKLWPAKAPDAAARLLADCLNENRSERLDPDQVILIARLARERDCHAVMQHLAAELGYVATAIEPADEAAELQRQYVEATKSLLRMAERIERLRSVA